MARFTQRQIQRMQMAAAPIQQPANVAFGGDFTSDGSLIQQFQIMIPILLP